LSRNKALTRKSNDVAVVRQFQSETDAIREAPDPWFARTTVWSLSGLIVLAIAGMAVTKLDRVVSSTGKIVPTRSLDVYQALDTSIIRTIDVREGEEVAKGQQLASLDPTFAAADVKQLQLQIIGLESQIARDRAQLENKPLEFEPSKDPDVLRYQDMNRSYYDQQLAQYKAQLNSFEAKIKETEATVKKYQADRDAYQQRADIAKQIEGMRTTLAEHGSGSVLNQLVSQDQHIDLVRNLEYDNNSLNEAQHTLASLNSDKQAFIQQWQANLSQDMVTARSSLDAAKAQLEKAVKHQDLVRWTADEPSIVLTVARLSVGSVLREGDPFLTLMPMNTPLEAESQVTSRNIGFVRVGDKCTLKIDAFNYMEHGAAEGKVRWISDDAFTTDDDGKPVDPYYKVRCSVDKTNFINIGPNFRLIPGMTLSADMKVGTRSALTYVVGGIMSGFGESMREP
jgi:HlyD family secretion protein